MTNTENHFIVEPETLAPTFEVGVRGMDCASCAQMLERSLAQLEGLEHVEVNFATARLRATGRVDRDAIARRVRALGYDLDDEPAAPGAEQVDRKSTRLNSSHVKISYAVFCLKKKITARKY